MGAGGENVYGFSAALLDGKQARLDAFAGRVLLVVNTASRCGFTPQYAALEQLYRTYRERGFEVLGFPCNQFGGQEPGSDQEIRAFCARAYAVTFPMFARIDVNGPSAHPLYQYLKASRPGILWTERIKWNFTKFLVDRGGSVVSRHAPRTQPGTLAGRIEALLEANAPVRDGSGPPDVSNLSAHTSRDPAYFSRFAGSGRGRDSRKENG
jgi:glutathione peroxidase